MQVYLRAMTAFLWVLWPLSTWAASVTLGDTLGDIPLRAWGAVLVLSLVSGLMALLQRMNRAVEVQSQIEALDPGSTELKDLRQLLAKLTLPKDWRLFIAWHMGGSVLMGAVAFWFVEASNVNDYIETVIIALASYSGARFMDGISQRLMVRVIDAVRKN